MKLIEFKEQTVVVAKDQPEYLPLPAYQYDDDEGTIAFCWKGSMMDRVKFLLTGNMWHHVLTFNKPLQPQNMSTDSPFK